MSMSLTRRSAALALAAATLAAFAGAQAVRLSSAHALSAPIHITEGVNVRPGPSVGSGGPITGIPAGASPDFNCWQVGQNVNGVDVWFNVNYAGKTGFYASFYDDSHYATDGEITGKYGIPRCGTPPAPAPSPTPTPTPTSGANGAENAAIAWARPFADRHDSTYNGLCLTFVFRAYLNAGVNLRPWVNVGINGNTYPQDIWGHFTHGRTGSGTPPAGALVFFSNGRRDWSHVELSLGGGALVSTSDRFAASTHYESMTQRGSAGYQGWWLPTR